ncbi:MAG: hypothetical protein WCO44_15660 [Bacteroidota bacterium]
MQTIRKTILTFTFMIFSIFTFNSLADAPLDAPPPPPGGGHGGGGNTQGAPIGGETEILMVLAFGYGTFRIYKSSRERIKPGVIATVAADQEKR